MGRKRLVTNPIPINRPVLSTRYVMGQPETHQPETTFNPAGRNRQLAPRNTRASKLPNMAKRAAKEQLTLEVLLQDMRHHNDPLCLRRIYPVGKYRPIGPIKPTPEGSTHSRIVPPFAPSPRKLEILRQLAGLKYEGLEYSKLHADIQQARRLLAEYDTRAIRQQQAAELAVTRRRNDNLRDYFRRAEWFGLKESAGLHPNGEPPCIEWSIVTRPAPDGLGKLAIVERTQPLTAIPNPAPQANGVDWFASSRLFRNRRAKLSDLVPLARP